jgi:hypothetical protein
MNRPARVTTTTLTMTQSPSICGSVLYDPSAATAALLTGCFGLIRRQLAFWLKPILQVMAGLSAALRINFVRATPDVLLAPCIQQTICS